jgi:formin-binding protein 1
MVRVPTCRVTCVITLRLVRGLYDYTAQGPDEMSIQAGQMIELSAGPNGGQNYGAGWWEGVSSSGTKGIFPSNYVSAAF